MNRAISVVMGSKSDLKTVKEAVDLLRKFRVSFELKALSAYRKDNDRYS